MILVAAAVSAAGFAAALGALFVRRRRDPRPGLFGTDWGER